MSTLQVLKVLNAQFMPRGTYVTTYNPLIPTETLFLIYPMLTLTLFNIQSAEMVSGLPKIKSLQ